MKKLIIPMLLAMTIGFFFTGCGRAEEETSEGDEALETIHDILYPPDENN